MGGGPPKDVLLAILQFPEPKKVLSNLRAKFPGTEIVYIDLSSTPQITNKEIQEQGKVSKDLWHKATILVTFNIFPEKIEDVPNLELVHLVSAGSNQAQDTVLWKEEGVAITTSSGIHGPQIAEWVIMTGLVASHRYNQLYELQKRRQWGGSIDGEPQTYRQVTDWVGRRIGILGYGSIGRQVGRVAAAMGMEVLAYTATPKDTKEKKRDKGFIVPGTGDEEGTIPREWFSGLEKEKLQEFLKQDLDWLLISVPLTKETRYFLSGPEFDALSNHGKKPAFVTNIARGPIIDQPALIEALKDGRLGGAALDVTDPEPLPKDNELWGLKNVVITPHVSSSSGAYTERTFQLLEANLERREKGERLINVVDRKRGY